MTSALRIVGAEVGGVGPLDVRIEGGRIRELRRAGAARSGEAARAGEGGSEAGVEVIDAGGGALLPGLHDHHIHLLALAATERSARCGPPQVTDEQALIDSLRAAPTHAGWLRGVGYHEAVAGPLDRPRLDALLPQLAARPLRIQHRSGAMWVVNSAGAEALGLDGTPAEIGALPQGVERDAEGRATGRLYRLDAWLRERLSASSPPDLRPLGTRLASYGVTGVTDASVGNGAAELALLAAAVDSGALPQRLLVMGGADLPLPRSRGANARVERGPLKILLAEPTLPSPELLAEKIEAAHVGGRAVAIHCVTRAELVLALVALQAAGCRSGDRIEHASVTPPDLMELLVGLPVTVVTQPNFIGERGDAYLEQVDAMELPWLYRGRGFLDAGVALGGGTDAPFGDADPWRAMAAAVERRSASGRILGAGEALTPERALALFTTPADDPGGVPRAVEVGASADLCLLDRPWSEARTQLSRDHVVATVCRGRVVWRR